MSRQLPHVTISRDPFARQETVREVVYSPGIGCSFCGQVKRTDNLFRYGAESDGCGARASWHSGRFCGKECHNAYHG